MPEIDGGEVAARIESDPALAQNTDCLFDGSRDKAETKSGLQSKDIISRQADQCSELINAIEENLPRRAGFDRADSSGVPNG